MTARDDFDAPPPEQGDLFDASARLKLELNDIDNARRIHGALGAEAIYVDGVGWMVWDGARYNSSAGEERMKRLVARELPRMLIDEAAASSRQPVPAAQIKAMAAEKEIPEDEAEKRIRAGRRIGRRQFALQCGNASRVRAATDMARGLFLRELTDLDVDRDRLQVANGTVRLDVISAVPESEDDEERLARWRSALIAPHDRGHRPTRVAGCAFDPEADAPEWRKFVDLVLPDPAMRLYLQVMVGLTLFGQEGERMLVLLGQGGNGKSTFIRALRRVWGHYAESCRIEMFCETRAGPGTGPTPEEAILPGARVYLASEPDTAAVLSAAKVKGLTGGDERQANPKNKALFSYTPIGVPIIQANRMMRVNDPSRGFWRRVYPVIFEVSLEDLPEAARRTSTDIDRALAAEASGILNWALEGWAIYRVDGIRMPPKAVALRESLQAMADPVGQFLRDRTEKVIGERVRTADLHKAFSEWMEAQGDKPMGNKAFATQMLALDYARQKTEGNWHWIGLRLVDATPLMDGNGGDFR